MTTRSTPRPARERVRGRGWWWLPRPRPRPIALVTLITLVLGASLVACGSSSPSAPTTAGSTLASATPAGAGSERSGEGTSTAGPSTAGPDGTGGGTTAAGTPAAGTTAGGTGPATPGQGAAPGRAAVPPEVRTITELADGWRFMLDDGLTEAEALAASGADWQPVSLPHTWNAQDAASLRATDYRRGVGWYRLEFATPATGVRHWLEIDAASLVASLWLNGRALGDHAGGFTAFRFELTDRMAPAGAPNVLLVRTDSRAPVRSDDPTAIAPLGGDFNVSGGLYRGARLVSTAAAIHLDLADLGSPGVAATTTAIGPERATIAVRVRVHQAGGSPERQSVRLTLLDATGTAAARADALAVLEPAATTSVDAELAVPRPHLWSGTSDPYLYRLVVELPAADGSATVLDRVSLPYGIRAIRVDPERGFFLNEQPLRLRGVAMHQDLLGKAWAIDDADLDRSLALIVELGANAVRFGHYPFSRHAYERASELGLMVWAETALGLGTTLEPERCSTEDADPRFVENAELQLRELIRQHAHEASIALWSVGNETSARQVGCEEPYDNVRPVLQALHDVAKQEDPSRPTAYAEYAHPLDDLEDGGPYRTDGITDLFATNRYYLWYAEPFSDLSPLLDALHARIGEQPLGVSEYGGGGALTHHTDDPTAGEVEVHKAPKGEPASYQPEEYQAYLHEQNDAVLSGKPYLWGTFIWNMFDFGSAVRNEGDTTGVNTKGLMTFDHQTHKDAFYYYQANWTDTPVTRIVGRRYADRAYPVTDVKVYSNADAVSLTLNGSLVGRLTADQCPRRTCVFEDVALERGVNRLTAVGDPDPSASTDTIEWTYDRSAMNIAAGQVWTGYVTRAGNPFGSDAFFSGGTGRWVGPGDPPGGFPPDIAGTNDPQLLTYIRTGTFSYDLPVPGGSYEVTLGFVEFDRDARVGDRVFSVAAGGRRVIEDLDILEEAGAAMTAVTRTFTAEATGDRLVIDFIPSQGDALVAYLKVAPATPVEAP